MDSFFHPYQLQKKLRKKTQKKRSKTRKNGKENEKLYRDPKHSDAKRYVSVKNNMIYIRGADGPSDKEWKVKGKINKDNTTILDFSSKGGPKNIKATIKGRKIVFSDGNFWKAEEQAIY